MARIGAVRRAVRRAVGGAATAVPLTGAQSELMRLVRRRPGISVAEAAGELSLAANTVSTLVGQLMDAEVLERRADPADRRIARLRLTPEASRRVSAWRDRRAAVVGAAIDELTGADRAAIEAALPAFARLSELLETR